MIALHNVNKSFGKDDAALHVLKGLDLSIAENEMVAITGKSGSGKSTLLNILGGLLACDSGEYLYRGQPVDFKKQKNLLQFRRERVGFILQYFALVGDMTIFENVALPLRYGKMPQREIRLQVEEMLQLLEIADKAKAYPDQLSGGQQQRAAIARALVKKPDFILADEPTGALDEETETVVLDIFKKMQTMGKTIVIVTHDENVAAICDRQLLLKKGVIS